MNQTVYSEEDLLPLAGIQHFSFCPRQWAIMTLEQQWNDNYLTAEGSLLHKRVDNPSTRERNGSDVITLRGLKLSSRSLGLSGIADAVELHPHDDAPGSKRELIESRKFDVLPVEYKHGKTKVNDCDRLQVAAQSMILEEMWNIEVNRAAIFYWETRNREYIDIDREIRRKVTDTAKKMHEIMRTGVTPKPLKSKSCRACSLANECIPGLSTKKASDYIRMHLEAEL